MIRNLEVTNFKAFQHASIELKPLTLLLGENNSGKSSILAALRMLSQSAQIADNSVPVVFDGPFGDFGSFRDVVHNNHRGRAFSISATVDAHRALTRRSLYSDVSTYSINTEFKFRTQRRETILQSAELSADRQSLVRIGRNASGNGYAIKSLDGRPQGPSDSGSKDWHVRMRNYLPSVSRGYMGADARENRAAYERARGLELSIHSGVSSLTKAFTAIDSLGAARTLPERTFIHSGVSQKHVGMDGRNWGSLLALEIAASSKESFVPALNHWLNGSGVASKITVDWLSDRHFEIRVQHPVTRESENVYDVGRGTSHVLPVIIGGLRLSGGSTYLVEEPESHLHPRAQANLGDFFVELCGRGVQSIVETHSEYLLMRVQQQIALGILAPEDVAIFYVEPTSEGKIVRQIELDENAVLRNGIPGGFFPQRMQEANALVAARGQGSRRKSER
jgi:predicted ATPase